MSTNFINAARISPIKSPESPSRCMIDTNNTSPLKASYERAQGEIESLGR